jgi:hypothetical protein
MELAEVQITKAKSGYLPELLFLNSSSMWGIRG